MTGAPGLPASRAGVQTPLSPSATASHGSAIGARSRLELAALLFLVAVAPYLNTLANGFVYDDETQVLNNPYLHGLSHLRQIFSTTVWSYVGVQGVTNYYRPLMTLGYLACYQLFGGALAYGFHLMNVLLHAAVVVLLFVLTERLVGSRAWAFAAAALFALHPVHTESVAWVAAVTDLEVTFFFLLAFVCFLKAARPGGGRRPAPLAAMAGSFVLALLAKEQALMLPVLAAAYEHFYRDDRRDTAGRAKLARYGPLWLLALAYIAFRVRFLGAFAPVTQIPNMTGAQAFLSGFALAGAYLAKLIWPLHLSAFYVFHKSATMLDPRVAAGLAALVALLAAFVWLWRRQRIASFGVVWFLVTLAPVLNARWMAANVFAERYLYLPSVGFCWVVGWLIVRLWESAKSRGRMSAALAGGALSLLAVLCAARIYARNRDWRNDLVLYTQTLAASPDAYPILNNLGTVYWRQGRVDEAERVWRRALDLAPRNAILWNNLGLVFQKRRDYAQAARFFEQAGRLKPNYTDPHLNLGMTFEEMGRFPEADEQLRAAVALSPLSTSARNELAKLDVASGRLPEAEEQFRRSAESQPNGVAFDGLGDIYLAGGDSGRAAQAFRRALALNAFDSHAHFGLAGIARRAGRHAEAIQEYRAGLETDPRNAAALAALAALGVPAAKAANSPPGDR